MATGGLGAGDLEEEAEVQRAIALSLHDEEAMFNREDDIEKTQQVVEAIVIAKIEEQGNILKQFERSKPDVNDNVVELSGMPWSAGEEKIREFLKDCEIVKILIILNNYRKSTGNAKVWLASKADLEKALLCDKKYIQYLNRQTNKTDRRYVYVRKPNKSTIIGSTTPNLHHGAFTVQLNSLPWSATQEQICDFLFGCEVIGGKNGVNIEMNEKGKPSGTAIVQLKTAFDVENALKFHKQKLGTRHVDVISLTTEVEEETTAKIEEETTSKVEEETTTKAEEENTAKIEEETTTKVEEETTAKLEEEITPKVEEETTKVEEKNTTILDIETTAKIEEETTTKVEEETTTMLDIETTAKIEEQTKTIDGTTLIEEETTSKEKPTMKERVIVKLSGVARKATVPDLSDFLSGGHVKFIEIIITRDSKGKPSGNAFIILDGEDNLEAALSLNNTAMGSRRIEVVHVNENEFEKEKNKITN